MTFRATVMAALLAVCATPLLAVAAVVEALQAPAWLTRGAERMPLAVGTALREGDDIRTGVNSRALLRLADGSRIKLGENASFGLARLEGRTAGGRALHATLRILEGAFRFTTDVAGGSRYRREVQVQFGTVTAGIRGTDLWGRNFGDREVVVLLEGRIEIRRGGDALVPMTVPGTYYQAPATGASSVQAIPADMLAEWAQQTEMQPGTGMQHQTGPWKLELARFDNQARALDLYDSVRHDGYAARILPLPAGGANLYSVRLTGFATEREAAALGERLKESYPLLAPTATRR